MSALMLCKRPGFTQHERRRPCDLEERRWELLQAVLDHFASSQMEALQDRRPDAASGNRLILGGCQVLHVSRCKPLGGWGMGPVHRAR